MTPSESGQGAGYLWRQQEIAACAYDRDRRKRIFRSVGRRARLLHRRVLSGSEDSGNRAVLQRGGACDPTRRLEGHARLGGSISPRRWRRNRSTCDDVAQILYTDPGNISVFRQGHSARPVKRESAWQKLLDMLQLIKPLADPPPGETDSGPAARWSSRISSLCRAPHISRGRARRARQLRSRGLSRRTYVRRRRARWHTSACSLQLDSRGRRSEQRSPRDAARKLPAERIARPPRQRARALHPDDVDRRGWRRFRRSLAPVAAASGPGRDRHFDGRRSR